MGSSVPIGDSTRIADSALQAMGPESAQHHRGCAVKAPDRPEWSAHLESDASRGQRFINSFLGAGEVVRGHGGNTGCLR